MNKKVLVIASHRTLLWARLAILKSRYLAEGVSPDSSDEALTSDFGLLLLCSSLSARESARIASRARQRQPAIKIVLLSFGMQSYPRDTNVDHAVSDGAAPQDWLRIIDRLLTAA